MDRGGGGVLKEGKKERKSGGKREGRKGKKAKERKETNRKEETKGIGKRKRKGKGKENGKRGPTGAFFHGRTQAFSFSPFFILIVIQKT